MQFSSFWVLPLLSAATWLSMLLAMLLKWVTDGSPHYPSMAANQHIAYISDIGAQYLKPLFIAGSCVTVISLDAAFLAERWLRHRGILVRNVSTSEKVFSGLAIVCAIAGAAGLILLSIFDTLRHPKLHDGFLLLFMGGYVLSAIFICAEYQRMGVHHRSHRILRISFWIKLAFILVEVALGATFAGLTFSSHQQMAAIFEWVVAAVFTFWVLSFFLDLLPAVSRWHHSGAGDARFQSAKNKANDEEAEKHEVKDGASNRYSNGHTNGHTNGSTNGHTNGHASDGSRTNGNAYRNSTAYGNGVGSDHRTSCIDESSEVRVPIGAPQESGDGAGLAPGERKYSIWRHSQPSAVSS